MKYHLLLSALVALHVSTVAVAAPGPGCAAKQADIESKLAAAQPRGNPQELAGLNTALRATKASCTEASLVRARAADIRKAQRELAKQERELAQAEKAGDPAKLEKRRAKLEDARRKLADAETPIAK